MPTEQAEEAAERIVSFAIDKRSVGMALGIFGAAVSIYGWTMVAEADGTSLQKSARKIVRSLFWIV